MIMLKPKRQKKCKVCKSEFQPRATTQVACSPKCAIECTKRANRKAFNAETRKRKAKLKSRADWLKEAQKAFNSYIRIRDKGKPCPSCFRSYDEITNANGWKVGGAWDCGHYRSRGAAKQLAFNLLNAWAECKSCNGGGGKFSHKDHTKTQNYRISLISRIGIERVKALENDNREARYTIEYAKRIKRIFTKRARIYKKSFRNLD